MNRQLKLEFDRTIKKLKSMPDAISPRVRKKILRSAADHFVDAARANIKDSTKAHHRYSHRGKLTSRLKAGKGSGRVIATYKPGNLRRSIQILRHGKFRRLQSVFVGPKADRSPSGVFGNEDKVDGYYAHMVEFGTVNSAPQPFMRPAFIASRGKVRVEIIGNMERRINRWKRKNGFK